MATAHSSTVPLVMGVLLLGSSGALAQVPYTPASDAAIVARLPAGAAVSRGATAHLRQRATARPHDSQAAVDLARHYLAIGRAAGDPRYYGYAQAALAPWWPLDSPPVAVQLLRAVIRQARHDFPGALADLDAVLRRQPRNPQAWLSRAVVLMAKGEPLQGLTSCVRLARLADPLSYTACTALAAGRLGQGAVGYRQLERVLGLGLAAEPAVELWAISLLGELAHGLGRFDDALTAYRRALAMGRRNVYLLAAYSDALLAAGRPGEVVELLAGETGNDGLLLRLALAEKQLDHPDFAVHRALLAARQRAARARDDTLHLREAARAALELFDDPHGALNLALANWELQREPPDARLVLAAALAAEQPGAAAGVLGWLTLTGLEHVAITPLVERLTTARDG